MSRKFAFFNEHSQLELFPNYLGVYHCNVALSLIISTRIHDRKMYVLGFCALMDLPREVRPQALLQCSPQILPALLTLFSGLKRAYESK